MCIINFVAKANKVVECFQLTKRISHTFRYYFNLSRGCHVIAYYAVDASHIFPGLAIPRFSFACQYRFLTGEISTSHIGNKYRSET